MAACYIKMEEVRGDAGSSYAFCLPMDWYLMHFPLDCFVFSGVLLKIAFLSHPMNHKLCLLCGLWYLFPFLATPTYKRILMHIVLILWLLLAVLSMSQVTLLIFISLNYQQFCCAWPNFSHWRCAKILIWAERSFFFNHNNKNSLTFSKEDPDSGSFM